MFDLFLWVFTDSSYSRFRWKRQVAASNLMLISMFSPQTIFGEEWEDNLASNLKIRVRMNLLGKLKFL
jgi:hypothetical protein